MIVYIQGKSGDASSRGFFAMRLDEDGDWVPIHGAPLPSSDAAFATCVVDLGDTLAALEDSISERLEAIQTMLARLRSSPREADGIRLLGQLCEVAKDGSVAMPAVPEEAAGPDSRPRPSLEDVELGHLMHQAIQRATRQPNLTRERALQILIDGVEHEPIEVLLSVDKTTPALRDEFTTLMLDIAIKRGLQPRWLTAWTDDPEPDSEPPTEPPAEPAE